MTDIQKPIVQNVLQAAYDRGKNADDPGVRFGATGTVDAIARALDIEIEVTE